jgi:hypothetical protein
MKGSSTIFVDVDQLSLSIPLMRQRLPLRHKFIIQLLLNNANVASFLLEFN